MGGGSIGEATDLDLGGRAAPRGALGWGQQGGGVGQTIVGPEGSGTPGGGVGRQCGVKPCPLARVGLLRLRTGMSPGAVPLAQGLGRWSIAMPANERGGGYSSLYSRCFGIVDHYDLDC